MPPVSDDDSSGGWVGLVFGACLLIKKEDVDGKHAPMCVYHDRTTALCS